MFTNKTKTPNISKDERGSITLITALAMTAVLGMGALVLDVGALYLERANISRAVDAAALAGVRDINQPYIARAQAINYAVANGLTEERTTVTINEQRNSLMVTAEATVPFRLARVLGFNEGVVSAPAEAQMGSITGFSGAVPLSVINQDFVYGQAYLLKAGAGGGVSGNYMPLALGSGGGSNYAHLLRYGYQGVLRVGDIVSTEPGNMQGPTRQAIDYRINSTDRSWTFDNATLDCPRLMIVPIIDNLNVGGRDTVEIVGFAAMWLEGYSNAGGQSTVTGRFKQLIVQGEFSPNQKDYGVRATKLIN